MAPSVLGAENWLARIVSMTAASAQPRKLAHAAAAPAQHAIISQPACT